MKASTRLHSYRIATNICSRGCAVPRSCPQSPRTHARLREGKKISLRVHMKGGRAKLGNVSRTPVVRLMACNQVTKRTVREKSRNEGRKKIKTGLCTNEDGGSRKRRSTINFSPVQSHLCFPFAIINFQLRFIGTNSFLHHSPGQVYSGLSAR